MNILLFVTTMIMILASLTYARIEMYRSFSVVQSQFNNYMEKTERSQTNNTAEWWYDNHHASKVSKINPASAKGKSFSRLSFYIFLDPQRRKGHEKEFVELHALAKKLIYLLYKDQPFFQEMERKHPDFVNTLLASLELQARLPQEQQVKRVEDLGSLNLNDWDLNEAFTKMLKGTAAEEEKPKAKTESMISASPPEEPAENDDQEEEKGKKREYHSSQGYYSLLDYITVKEAYKVRVYLAPQLLLTAIFDDPEVVKAIVETRNNIFKQVVSGEMTPAAATTQFENAFASRVDPAFKAILDFTVTKTNPQHYE